MKKEQMIQFANAVCEVLNLTNIDIEIEDGLKAGSSTTMAIYDNEKKVIKIKNSVQTLDLLFAIAHELRHAWQIKENEAYWMNGYKSVKELGVEDYNLQPAEIDANAFGAIIMMDIFGVKPLWHGLTKNVIQEIDLRIAELKKETLKQGFLN